MRRSASSRIVLLAVLLTASQVVFSSHVTTHLDSRLSSCDWCVCQGQTFAAPLPGAEPVALMRQSGPQQTAPETTRQSEPVSPNYQPRAPPAVL